MSKRVLRGKEGIWKHVQCREKVEIGVSCGPPNLIKISLPVTWKRRLHWICYPICEMVQKNQCLCFSTTHTILIDRTHHSIFPTFPAQIVENRDASWQSQLILHQKPTFPSLGLSVTWLTCFRFLSFFASNFLAFFNYSALLFVVAQSC